MRDWPRGRRVRLRPLTVDDQPFMDRLNANRSPYTSFDRPRRRTLAEKLADGPLVTAHGGDALITRLADDASIGVVDWRAVYYGPRSETRSRSWMVGRELLPEHRGHGYGKEVMWLLIDWLFRVTDTNRIEGRSEVTNVASHRSVEPVGLRREGLLRQAVYRAGQHRDLIIYGLTRTEWQALRSEVDGGLDAAEGRTP